MTPASGGYPLRLLIFFMLGEQRNGFEDRNIGTKKEE